MADENTQQGETPEQQPPASETPPVDTQEETPQEDEFDKDRAMVTIKNLRVIEKQSKKDAKQLKTLLEAEDKRKKSEMDESERLKAELKEAQAANESMVASQRLDRVRYAVENAAREQKVIEGAVPDVFALIDQSKIEFDEDGLPQEVDKAVKAVLKTRAHMIASTNGRTDNDASHGSGSALTGGYTLEKIAEIASFSGVSAERIKEGLGVR